MIVEQNRVRAREISSGLSIHHLVPLLLKYLLLLLELELLLHMAATLAVLVVVHSCRVQVLELLQLQVSGCLLNMSIQD